VTETELIATPARLEVAVIRGSAAPCELVFNAHTDPAVIPQWWGPRWLTTTVDTMEVRPRGIWRFGQYDAGGTPYALHGAYHSVEAPQRLVDTFELGDTPGRVVLQETAFESWEGV